MDDDQTSNPSSERLPDQESGSASEQLDAAIPELLPDADKNERIRLANLIGRQIAYYVGQKEAGTFIAFTADLAIIPRIIALKRCLVRSADFIQAARNCHVSKNDAYAIVRLRLDKVINDIKLDAEIAKRKAEAKGVAFDYPDLKAMIKEYTPPPVNNQPQPVGTADTEETDDDAGGDGAAAGSNAGGKSNRTLKDYQRENLHLTEANRLLAAKLATAEAAARTAEEREATLRRDRDAVEQRLADTEARLAELLRVNNNRAPDNPSHEFTSADADSDVAVEHGLGGDEVDDGEIPPAPCKNTDPPRRIRNGMLTLDEIKALEAYHHIKGWRGHGATSHARQVRADFIAQWDTIEPDAPPPQRLMDQPPAFWESQHDALIGDLIPAHPDDDPPHTDLPEPPPAASQPAPDTEPEPEQETPQPDRGDPDPARPDPQHDRAPAPVEPVPETPASQHGDPGVETPPSDGHERDAADPISDHEQPVSLDKLPHDPCHTPIGSVELVEGIAETEDTWDLRPMWSGRASSEDRAAARWYRAAAFQLLGQIVDGNVFVDQTAKTLRFQKHKFWCRVSNMTLHQVIFAAAGTPKDDPPSGSKAGSEKPQANLDPVKPEPPNDPVSPAQPNSSGEPEPPPNDDPEPPEPVASLPRPAS